MTTRRTKYFNFCFHFITLFLINLVFAKYARFPSLVHSKTYLLFSIVLFSKIPKDLNSFTYCELHGEFEEHLTRLLSNILVYFYQRPIFLASFYFLECALQGRYSISLVVITLSSAHGQF